MAASSSISIVSLDAVEEQLAPPAAIAVKRESAIPCVVTSSDFEAIYQHHCAEMLSRAQPAIVLLKSATPWVVEDQPITFTVPPAGDPDAPGSRLRRLEMLENAEAYETVEFTAYPYVQELLGVVAGTGDLPPGYDPWLAIFTAVYLALPTKIIARLCEDLIWGLGGDRDAFSEVFHISARSSDYNSITFKNESLDAKMPNRQYVVVALNALREYLHSKPSTSSESTTDPTFTFYELSVRFPKPNEPTEWCNCPRSDHTDQSPHHIHIYWLSNSNPRMLHHILTSQTTTPMIDVWPTRGLNSPEATIFAEILCAYINSRRAWNETLVMSVRHALVEVAAVAQNFEFANILLSNIVASAEFEFDATVLLTASARHCEVSYLAWCSFVKRAEVLAITPRVSQSKQKYNTVELQCALLRYDMLQHAEDKQLQEFMLANLEQMVSNHSVDYMISTVSEHIRRMFIKGRTSDIRRLHRLGLDIEYLREGLKRIDCDDIEYGFIRTLEFAEEQGWFRAGGTEYRDVVMHQLLKGHGAFDAVKWLYAKYPEMGATAWSAFREHTVPPLINNRERTRLVDVSRCERENYGRGVRWVLLENQRVWRIRVDESLIFDSIRMRDYQCLHLLYTVVGMKPNRTHAQAALRLVIKSYESGKRATHAMYLMLHCIRDALRANGVQLNLHEFILTAGSGVDTVALAWMMRRGFFTKPTMTKQRVRKTSSSS
jgi:hypothetical protein